MQEICCVCVTFFLGRFESSNWVGFIFLYTLISWAATAVAKGCHLVALLKCSPAHLWQMLSWQISLFEEQSDKGALSKVWRRAFLRECSLGLSKMLSHILWQNALQTKCSWGQEHFARRAFCQRIWESIFEDPRKHSLKNALLHTFKNAPLVYCSLKRAFCQDSIL